MAKVPKICAVPDNFGFVRFTNRTPFQAIGEIVVRKAEMTWPLRSLALSWATAGPQTHNAR